MKLFKTFIAILCCCMVSSAYSQQLFNLHFSDGEVINNDVSDVRSVVFENGSVIVNTNSFTESRNLDELIYISSKMTISGISKGESSFPNTLNVYPNPSNGSVWIESFSEGLTHASVSIISLDGKIIKAFEYCFGEAINLNLSDGVYYLKVANGDEHNYSKKLIVLNE